jgi:Predicted acetyltransferase
MELKVMERVKGVPKRFAPYVLYSLLVDGEEVGRLILRDGSDKECYYEGHIGYTIFEEYRGHHYAYEGCLLLREFIDRDHVLITTDPNNIPSQKTIQKLGCKYIETKEIPKDVRKFFTNEERVKDIYIWNLKDD